MEGRTVLIEQLVNLLGFDDGTSDVLEHLLSIESSEDLIDYLSQLLGRSDDDVKEFVANVALFQRGELTGGKENSSSSAAKTATNAPTSQLPAKKEQQNPAPVAKKTTAQPTKKNKAISRNQKRQQTAPAASKPASSQSKNALPPSTPNYITATPSAAPMKKESNAAKLNARPLPPKCQPTKGKAAYDCGCYGSYHRALTNCLYCGRVLCEREGYGFCPFCGYSIEKVERSAADETNEAWLHKERLLRYDRDHAKRSTIIDDQVDYASSMIWMSEEERQEARVKNAERQEEMSRRGKMTLKL